MANTEKASSTPRAKNDRWNSAFFKRFGDAWIPDSHSTRCSPLGTFLAGRLALDPKKIVDSFLLFEVRTFNDAFNGGKTIRNPSFLVVEGEWSRFDALVILPVAQTLLFIESKLESDGTHGASGHEVPQPIRNLETAFFLTTLPDSQYCGWDFRYVLLCPKSDAATRKECERFFVDGLDGELDNYDCYLKDSSDHVRASADRATYLNQWATLRGRLKQRLALVYWSEIMTELCRLGFDPQRYLAGLASIDRHNNTIVAATKRRWAVARLEPS